MLQSRSRPGEKAEEEEEGKEEGCEGKRKRKREREDEHTHRGCFFSIAFCEDPCDPWPILIPKASP